MLRVPPGGVYVAAAWELSLSKEVMTELGACIKVRGADVSSVGRPGGRNVWGRAWIWLVLGSMLSIAADALVFFVVGKIAARDGIVAALLSGAMLDSASIALKA